MPRIHLPELLPCPYLPSVGEPMAASAMKSMGKERGGAFYLLALECAQSLWLQGLPAQSLLLMNRAFSSDLVGDEPELARWPLPYQAMRWVMSHRTEEQFIGNPRRHFQHLATRMVEPRKELRSWRAWACWWLACGVFPAYPADEKQLREEGVLEPLKEQIEASLSRVGLDGEVSEWLVAATPPFRES